MKVHAWYHGWPVFVERGGKGSGHHGHKGRPGKQGGSAPGIGGTDGHPTKAHVQAAGKVAILADSDPAALKKVATSHLLAARGVSEDLLSGYKGVRGKGEMRDKIKRRMSLLDDELGRRGIKDSVEEIRKIWPEWKFTHD